MNNVDEEQFNGVEDEVESENIGEVNDSPFVFQRLLSDKFGKSEFQKVFTSVLNQYKLLSMFPNIGNNTPMCYYAFQKR